jgi:hypothetical protein
MDNSIIVSHIYGEGNHCADKLVSLSLSMNVFNWWNVSPTESRGDLACNRLDLPHYKFC